MYLHQFRLRNTACFKDLTLDLTHSGKPCPWLVLLGENGTGKTTILQMLGLALIGHDMARDVARDIEWKKFIRAGAKKAQIEADLLTTTSDKGRKKAAEGGYQDSRSAIEIRSTDRIGLSQDREASSEDLDKTLYADRVARHGWFACGYGPWRRLLRVRPIGPSGQLQSTSSRKADRFVTMFDEESALTRVGDWLVDLEFRRLKEPDNEAAQRFFDLAVDALEQVLVGVKFRRITSEGDVIFEEDGTEVSIDHFSDGYRSLAAWVGDLVRRMVEAFPNLKSPLKAPGIVLVDEIDLHLHPKWQGLVVEHIRKLFPKLQFIVSSHSPFVAQDMRPEDKIIVLKRQGGKTIASEDAGSVMGWRADQILTSRLFGLETTRDLSIASAEREYQELLDRRAMGEFTAKDKRRLSQLKKWLREHQSPPGETTEENDLYNATQSIIDIPDEHLSQ